MIYLFICEHNMKAASGNLISVSASSSVAHDWLAPRASVVPPAHTLYCDWLILSVTQSEPGVD